MCQKSEVCLQLKCSFLSMCQNYAFPSQYHILLSSYRSCKVVNPTGICGYSQRNWGQKILSPSKFCFLPSAEKPDGGKKPLEERDGERFFLIFLAGFVQEKSARVRKSLPSAPRSNGGAEKRRFTHTRRRGKKFLLRRKIGRLVKKFDVNCSEDEKGKGSLKKLVDPASSLLPEAS